MWIIYHSGTDFAYLVGGSTLETWRKRGIYRALGTVRAPSGATDVETSAQWRETR